MNVNKEIKEQKILKKGLKCQKYWMSEPTMGSVPLDLLFVKREGLVAGVTEIVLGTAIKNMKVLILREVNRWIIRSAILTSGGQTLASLEDWL